MNGAEGRRDALHSAPLLLGAATVLIPTLIRTVTTIDPMPAWGTDLLIMWIPPTEVGPLGTLVLDLLTVLGCAVVVLATPLHVRTVAVALALVGCLAVLIHSGGDDAHALVGMPWVAAVCAGLAAAHLPRGSAARTAMIGAAFGIVALLGAKALVQVFIEHPATIDNYRHTRESFLASRGWTPDSVMARNYERRLFQAEATGWFGLANVFGSLAAAWTAAFAVACFLTLRTRIADRRVPIVLALATVLAGVALALSGSKGAFGALLLATPALIVVMRSGRRAPLVVALVPIVVLAGVIVRGLIGERLGELSILFRWFYIQGATGVFLDHPILGVGPAGFKDAYMLAKPAISPEEVASPHSIFFDWLATLGVLGGAWIVLLAGACRNLAATATNPGARPVRGDSTHAILPGSSTERAAALLAAGAIAVAVGASAFFERALLTPEMGVARATGLVFGLAIGAAAIRAASCAPRAIDLALVGAALVLLAHTQIETTLVSPGGAPLAALLVGLACAPPSRPRCRRANPLAAGAIGAVALVAGAVVGPPMLSWSRSLGRATEAVRPIGEALSELDAALPGSVEQSDAIARIAALASASSPRTSDELAACVLVAKRQAAIRALPGLEAALDARPGDLPTREAAIRLLAALAGPLGDSARSDEHARRALDLAEQGAQRSPGSPSAWGLLANTHLALLGREPGASLDRAVRAAGHAAALDPHGLNYPLKLVDLYLRAENPQEARSWARRALRVDQDLRLDPLRQLTDEQRARLERLAAG